MTMRNYSIALPVLLLIVSLAHAEEAATPPATTKGKQTQITPSPTPEVNHSQTPESSTQETPQSGVQKVISTATEAVLPKPKPPEHMLKFKAGYGVTAMGYQQTGSLGAIAGSVVSPKSTMISGFWTNRNLYLSGEYQQYSFTPSTASNNFAPGNKHQISDLNLKIGKGVVFIGAKQLVAPLSLNDGLYWVDLSTYYAILGIGSESDLTFTNQRPIQFYGEIQALYPFYSSGSLNGLAVSDCKGYGGKMIGSVQRSLFRSPLNDPKQIYIGHMYFGLQGAMGYYLTQMKGSWQGSSGKISRRMEDLSMLLFLQLRM